MIHLELVGMQQSGKYSQLVVEVVVVLVVFWPTCTQVDLLHVCGLQATQLSSSHLSDCSTVSRDGNEHARC